MAMILTDLDIHVWSVNIQLNFQHHIQHLYQSPVDTIILLIKVSHIGFAAFNGISSAIFGIIFTTI